ncbi:MAG: bacteriohemerythrin [Pseudomonadota bacterium]
MPPPLRGCYIVTMACCLHIPRGQSRLSASAGSIPLQGKIMTYLVWSHDLAVGNNFIDHDHQKLIDMVNRLHTLMQEGKGKDALAKVLRNLITYTQEHFRREEDMMQEMQYGGYLAHKREHESLLVQVLDLQHRFESGVAALTIEVLHFMRDWLIHHIGESDKDLAIASRQAA